MVRFGRGGFLGLALLLAAGCGGPKEEGQSVSVTLKVSIDSIGTLTQINEAMAAEFRKETGIAVEFVVAPDNATERLAEYQRFLGAQSPDIDIYTIDVTWPSLLGEHLEDVSDAVTPSDFFPAMIENNRVGARLLAVPFYADAPLLYYRRDLLERHGFKAPPATWEEMEAQARAIMEGERKAGNADFHGFVFQGAAYEGLTCNALEWQASEGGGEIVKEGPAPDINTPGARRAFERARGWVGTIAPRGVLTYKEEDARLLFQQGNAAFMRNWPYAFAQTEAEGSPVRGKVGIALLPKGAERSAATLGGWSLAVSRHSRHRAEAKRLVAFLSTKDAQRRRALEGGYLATRPDVYGDAAIAAKIPHFATMRDVFASCVARPARRSGRVYNEVSAIYFGAVHAILNNEQLAEPALAEAEKRAGERLAALQPHVEAP